MGTYQILVEDILFVVAFTFSNLIESIISTTKIISYLIHRVITGRFSKYPACRLITNIVVYTTQKNLCRTSPIAERKLCPSLNNTRMRMLFVLYNTTYRMNTGNADQNRSRNSMSFAHGYDEHRERWSWWITYAVNVTSNGKVISKSNQTSKTKFFTKIVIRFS